MIVKNVSGALRKTREAKCIIFTQVSKTFVLKLCSVPRDTCVLPSMEAGGGPTITGVSHDRQMAVALFSPTSPLETLNLCQWASRDRNLF